MGVGWECGGAVNERACLRVMRWNEIEQICIRERVLVRARVRVCRVGYGGRERDGMESSRHVLLAQQFLIDTLKSSAVV